MLRPTSLTETRPQLRRLRAEHLSAARVVIGLIAYVASQLGMNDTRSLMLNSTLNCTDDALAGNSAASMGMQLSARRLTRGALVFDRAGVTRSPASFASRIDELSKLGGARWAERVSFASAKLPSDSTLLKRCTQTERRRWPAMGVAP